MAGIKKTNVRVSPRLKGRIARTVEKGKLSMNDVVVGILATAYEVPFEPVGLKRTKPIGPQASLILSIPEDLYDAIMFDARTHDDSLRNRIVKTLSDHFGINYTPTGRWPQHTVHG